MRFSLCGGVGTFASRLADFDGSLSQIDGSHLDRMRGMRHRWPGIVGVVFLVGGGLPSADQSAADHSTNARFARIAIMRALDGHSIEWEAGYIRHLGWHRQAKDPFGWYSYSVWASTERQRWIVYATFGHTAAELSNPVSPADDERDNLINVLPHAQFLGNWIYESCPRSREAMVCRHPLFVPSTRRWI